MTSSWSLTKRKTMGGGQTWNIKNFSHPSQDSLGGWEDHYIVNGGCRECSPGYEAIPIGNPYGFQICKKRLKPRKPIDPSRWNGYHKYMADLYCPLRNTQIQMYNPDYYWNRRAPYEKEHIRNDMLRLPMKYNGTGVEPIHTPSQSPEKTRFFEYGYSYTDEPPYKYDVTRLEQPYPVWKKIQEYHYPQTQGKDGPPFTKLDELDQTYFDNNKGW